MTARMKFDCPIPWCAGDVEGHGADGAEPERWFHEDDGVDLPHGLFLCRSQEGAGDVSHSLFARSSGVVLEAPSGHEIAHRLRAIADAVERY